MGLFLSREEMWDRPLGSHPELKGHIPHWAGNVLWVLVGGICKILFRYKVVGREHIRRLQGQTGALVMGNHVSYADVVFFYLAPRPQQWMRLMGRDTLFNAAGGLGGQILSRVGAFPVKRDSADRQAVKRAVSMLKRKELVGIYPEGTRRGKGSVAPSLHEGGAFIARMAQVPIVPATVRNAEKIKPKGKCLHFPYIEVIFGEPVEVSEFDFLPKEERLQACTWYVLRECYALSRGCKPEEVNMLELFPEMKDYSATFDNTSIARGAKVLQDQG